MTSKKATHKIIRNYHYDSQSVDNDLTVTLEQ